MTKSAARRIIDQLIENEQRADLTEAERSAAWQQLAFEGMTPNSIAKKTGTKVDRVKHGLAVAENAVATAAVVAHEIDLEQAAILIEFEDSPEVVGDLIEIVKTERKQFRHAAQRARTDRDLAAKIAEHAEKMREAGYEVLVERPRWDDDDYLSIHRLRTADGKAVDRDTLALLEGRAVTIDLWRVDEKPQCDYYLRGWKEAGYRDRDAETGRSSNGGPMTDEQKAERKALIANQKAWAAAEAVRLDWLTKFISRKTLPKDAPLLIARGLTFHRGDVYRAMQEGNGSAHTLLRIERGTGWRSDKLSEFVVANPSKAQHVSLAIVLGGIEDNTDKSAWRYPDAEKAAYLAQIAAWDTPSRRSSSWSSPAQPPRLPLAPTLASTTKQTSSTPMSSNPASSRRSDPAGRAGNQPARPLSTRAGQARGDPSRSPVLEARGYRSAVDARFTDLQTPKDPDMLTNTHTYDAGRIIDATSKGDGSSEVLKANRWRWDRSIAAWYMPNRRDHRPNRHRIEATAAALRDAGFEVATAIDDTTRTTAEVEAGKIARQEDRVNAVQVKAERKSDAADVAWESAKRALYRAARGRRANQDRPPLRGTPSGCNRPSRPRHWPKYRGSGGGRPRGRPRRDGHSHHRRTLRPGDRGKSHREDRRRHPPSRTSDRGRPLRPRIRLPARGRRAQGRRREPGRAPARRAAGPARVLGRRSDAADRRRHRDRLHARADPEGRPGEDSRILARSRAGQRQDSERHHRIQLERHRALCRDPGAPAPLARGGRAGPRGAPLALARRRPLRGPPFEACSPFRPIIVARSAGYVPGFRGARARTDRRAARLRGRAAPLTRPLIDPTTYAELNAIDRRPSSRR